MNPRHFEMIYNYGGGPAIKPQTDSFGGTIFHQFDRKGDGAVGTVYDDRMGEWDRPKLLRSMEQAFGDTRAAWEYRSVDKLEAFLSLYLGKPVRLLALIKYVNGYGYDNWRFDYQEQ